MNYWLKLLAITGPLVLAGLLDWWLPGYPQLGLFIGCLLCATATVSLLLFVDRPLTHEVGRDDAAHAITAAWFVLLISSMAAASLWNIFQWPGPACCPANPPAACLLTAYVSIPKEVWVLAGITLTANFGVRLAFRLNRGEARSSRNDDIPKVQQLMSSPLDLDAKPQMGIAQYLMLNMVGILVYGIAIARIFGVVNVRESVGRFPRFHRKC